MNYETENDPELYINDIPASTIRMRWTIRKVERSYKRRLAGETTHQVAQDMGTSAQALRAAWRSMGLFLKKEKISDEELAPIVERYNQGELLAHICRDLECDYRRTYAALRYRKLLPPKGSKWTERNEIRLLDLTRQGYPDELIAEELGRSVGAIRNKRVRLQGRRTNHSWTNHKVRKAERWMRAGISRDVCAHRLGCSTAALAQALNRYGVRVKRDWTPELVAEMAARLRNGEEEFRVAQSYGIQISSMHRVFERKDIDWREEP